MIKIPNLDDWKKNKHFREICMELCEEMEADTIIIVKRTNYVGKTVYNITGLNKYSELSIW